MPPVLHVLGVFGCLNNWQNRYFYNSNADNVFKNAMFLPSKAKHNFIKQSYETKLLIYGKNPVCTIFSLGKNNSLSFFQSNDQGVLNKFKLGEFSCEYLALTVLIAPVELKHALGTLGASIIILIKIMD